MPLAYTEVPINATAIAVIKTKSFFIKKPPIILVILTAMRFISFVYYYIIPKVYYTSYQETLIKVHTFIILISIH